MDKLNYDKLSINSLNSNNKRKVIIKNNKKKEGIYKGLKDNKRGVLLNDNKHILKLIWKKDTSNYFWEVKGCNLPITKN